MNHNSLWCRGSPATPCGEDTPSLLGTPCGEDTPSLIVIWITLPRPSRRRRWRDAAVLDGGPTTMSWLWSRYLGGREARTSPFSASSLAREASTCVSGCRADQGPIPVPIPKGERCSALAELLSELRSSARSSVCRLHACWSTGQAVHIRNRRFSHYKRNLPPFYFSPLASRGANSLK